MLNELLAGLGLAGKAAAAALASTLTVGGLAVAHQAVTADHPPAVESVETQELEADELRGGTDEELEITGNGEGEGPPEGAFGARVSEDAKDGGVEGLEIADEASDGRSSEGLARAASAADNAPEDIGGQPEDTPGPPEDTSSMVPEDAQQHREAGEAHRPEGLPGG